MNIHIWALYDITHGVCQFKTRGKKAMKYPFPVPSPNPNPNYNTKS